MQLEEGRGGKGREGEARDEKKEEVVERNGPAAFRRIAAPRSLLRD